MTMTYAIGDIHGSLDKLSELVARCDEDANRRPSLFVFLGDYIDRGLDSAGVVRLLLDLKSGRGDSVVTLSGNHEAMALAVIDGASPPEFWLEQGGEATLQSYGVAQPCDLPAEHIDWMRSLRLTYDDGRRFFVHAGVDPMRPLNAQDAEDLIWIREPFLSDQRDYGRLIVHGHTPVMTSEPDMRRNRLNLDTGAVYGGPLTAAVFDEAQTRPIRFLQVP